MSGRKIITGLEEALRRLDEEAMERAMSPAGWPHIYRPEQIRVFGSPEEVAKWESVLKDGDEK